MITKENQRTMTRKLLLDAAIKEFSVNGYTRAKISDIVARAGYSQRTFYLYFESKEAMFQELLKPWKEQLSEKFELKGDDYRASIIKRWEEIIEYMTKDLDYSRAVYFTSPYFEETRTHFLKLLNKSILSDQKSCNLRTDISVGILAESILSSMEGLAFRYVPQNTVDNSLLAQQMVDMYISGLGND